MSLWKEKSLAGHFGFFLRAESKECTAVGHQYKLLGKVLSPSNGL